MQTNPNLDELFPTAIVNINSKLYRASEAKISIFDRGFLYGDSIYETFPVRERIPLFLEDHIKRLLNSAELLAMPLVFMPEDIIKEMQKTIKASTVDDQYLRIIITRGESSIGLTPNSDLQNNLVIISKDLPENPSWMYEKGVSLFVSSVQRNDPKATDPNAKSGNYLNNVMAHIEAKKKNFYDAVMVNKEGHVAEGTTFNVWMIKDGVIKTPPQSAGLLMGITRSKVIEVIQNSTDFQFVEENFTAQEFENADEAFITSSLRSVVPISHINNSELTNGFGPMTAKINEGYLKLVQNYLRENTL